MSVGIVESSARFDTLPEAGLATIQMANNALPPAKITSSRGDFRIMSRGIDDTMLAEVPLPLALKFVHQSPSVAERPFSSLHRQHAPIILR